jgi:hypothetical protein
VDCLLKPLGVDRLRTIRADARAMHAALHAGSALRLHKPDAAALADIDALAESLVGSGPPPTTKAANPRGFLHRLGRPRWARSQP